MYSNVYTNDFEHNHQNGNICVTLNFSGLGRAEVSETERELEFHYLKVQLSVQLAINSVIAKSGGHIISYVMLQMLLVKSQIFLDL